MTLVTFVWYSCVTRVFKVSSTCILRYVVTYVGFVVLLKHCIQSGLENGFEKKPRFFRFSKVQILGFSGFIIFVQFFHRLCIYCHILVEICGFCYNL